MTYNRYSQQHVLNFYKYKAFDLYNKIKKKIDVSFLTLGVAPPFLHSSYVHFPVIDICVASTKHLACNVCDLKLI